MSGVELKCDDAEPPSRHSHRFSISIVIDDAIDASNLPPLDQLNGWMEHAILGVPSLDSSATHFELSVSVVDEAAIQALNNTYRSKNTPTNVLSFPSGMPAIETSPGEPSYQVLGDVVVCHSVIEAESIEQKKPLAHHYAHMLVHSVLHLFGYDHENEADAVQMEALETQLLYQLSIPNPY